jgi:hypothetical protein
VPGSLVEQKRGVSAGSHGSRDLFEVMGHGRRGAAGHDEACAHAPVRADRPEEVGRLRTLILRDRRSRSAFGPASGERLLLADTGLVAEPDLYGLAADSLGDLRQTAGEAFLKRAAASGSWAWWRGRAESLR